MRILLYLLMLILGIWIGYKEISHKKLLDGLDKLQLLALIILLLVMGIRIGADPDVMDSIQIIGFRGFVFALITIVFSVLPVFIYTRFIMKGGQKR